MLSHAYWDVVYPESSYKIALPSIMNTEIVQKCPENRTLSIETICVRVDTQLMTKGDM